MPGKEWQPSISDVLWQQQLIDTMKDGAVWGTTWGSYRLDKSNEVVTLIHRLDPFDVENHNRVVLTFRALAWKFIDES